MRESEGRVGGRADEMSGSSSTPPTVEAVAAALDEIFAPANRADDAYLRSLMTSQLCVPLAALGRCERLSAMGADDSLIAQAACSSAVVSLDTSGTMLRPVDLAVRRNTLVLREVGEGASAAEVTSVFEREGCPRPRSPARAETSDSWVVTFDDEERCLHALEATRSLTCNGRPVRARVRGEDLRRSLPPIEVDVAQTGASGGAAVERPAADVPPDGEKMRLWRRHL